MHAKIEGNKFLVENCTRFSCFDLQPKFVERNVLLAPTAGFVVRKIVVVVVVVAVTKA